LSTDFPYKGGDRTNDEFTICFWIKHHGVWDPENPFEDEYYATDNVFRKYLSGFVTFGVTMYWWNDITVKGQLMFVLHTDEGGNNEEYHSFNGFTQDKWYHVAVTYTPGEYRIRVFDNDAEDQLGVDVTGVAGTIKENAGYVQIRSYRSNGTNSTTWLDEMYVFNRVLTVEEIDEIRSGSLPSGSSSSSSSSLSSSSECSSSESSNSSSSESSSSLSSESSSSESSSSSSSESSSSSSA